MAVQDAELQLKVSLDLAFFRRQLSGLGQAAAGYNVPINVKFDRRSIQNELNALGRNISQRTYRLEVATNISQEIKNAGTLAKALRGLDNAIQRNRGIANRTATGTAGGTVDAGRIQALVNKATKPALQALYSEMSKANIPMAAVGKETVANLRNAILSGVPQLTSDLARGISNGLNPQMKESGAQGAKLFVDAFKNATGIASPSKVFKALGEFSADGLEIGFMNGLKDFKTRAVGEIKQIVALMKLELASVGDVRMGPGTGAARAGTRGGRQYMNPIGPLPTGSREPWAFSQYRYQPFMAQPGQVRGAGVPPMRTRQPFLPAPPVMGTTSSPGMLGQARLALPAAGETSARAMREAALALREFTARQRSDARSASVMGENRMWSRVAGQVPVGAGGPFLPPGAGGGVPPRPPSGGGGGGMGGFGRALGGINLPGTGVVREIGDEFAMATKQVLLFGTAYKALAFLTSFPAQVGQAVGALQSFNNTLKAISPTAEEARASNQFILDIVDRYNVPLQSARDGFTKLYASMAPAGFQGDEIRDLFTGVSQAAATFGMSADKVDRVNYAFAQMASKGQVMSEELKGQLGDVLPGAMGIFAEAAGLEGPDAIQKFSEALEDGVYKGEAMRVLLKNVSVVLTKEFGPGAEGAARTFQGVINRMQNSTQLLYEAFEPVAVGFLNSVVVPLTSGIKTVADGFNAFFTGTQAKTAGGMAFAQELERLRPTFEGLQANITALIPSFQLFGSALLNVAKFLATVAGNPITGFLLKVYANVLLVNTAFTLLGGRILVGLITNIGLATSRFIAMNAAVFALQRTSAVTNSTLAGTQLQMMLLQRNATGAIGPVSTLLGSLVRMAGIGAIAVGITIIVNGLTELRDAEARIARLRGEKDPVGPAGPRPIATAGRRYTGATREKVTADQQKQIDYVARLRKELTSLEATQTKAGGALSQTAVGGLSNILGGFRKENTEAKITELRLLISNAEEVINLDPSKFKTAAEQQRASVAATVTGGATGATGGGAKPAKERESQIPQLMLRLEKTRELAALELQITNATLTNNTAQISSLELAKQLVEFKYEAKELDLQDLTTAEKGIAKREIALRTEQAILSSQLQLQIDLRKERDSIQQGFSKILEGYEEESGYQQMYLKLIDQGIRPALAKARVEVEKSFKEQEKQLDASIALNKENIAATEITIEQFKLQKNLSEESKKQLADAERRLEILKEELGLREGIKAGVPDAKGKATEEAEKGLMPKTPGEYIAEGLEAAEDRLKELTNMGYQVVEAANAIGDAFGTAFKGVLTGSMTAREALAGFFQSVADHFADMVSQMIAEWLKAQLIKGFMSLFPGGGALAGATSAASTGLSFDPGGMAGFSAPWAFAKGGIAPGGFQAFANGGIVTGPTLGLVGEGRYNEAVIPLPDGRSVPVELSGGGSSSPTVIVNVDAKGSQVEGNEQNANQLGRVISAAVQTELIKQQRPGGLLAR
jgi:tape measure domain-containing protein